MKFESGNKPLIWRAYRRILYALGIVKVPKDIDCKKEGDCCGNQSKCSCGD